MRQRPFVGELIVSMARLLVLLVTVVMVVEGMQPAVDPELAVRSESAESMFVFPSMKMNVLSLVRDAAKKSFFCLVY